MDKLISITIANVAPKVGDVTEKVNVNQPVRQVKVSAMGRLGIQPSQADDYVLTFEGAPLPDENTIAETGVTDLATLSLCPVEGEGHSYM
jgi:hypothetical protein